MRAEMAQSSDGAVAEQSYDRAVLGQCRSSIGTVLEHNTDHQDSATQTALEASISCAGIACMLYGYIHAASIDLPYHYKDTYMHKTLHTWLK